MNAFSQLVGMTTTKHTRDPKYPRAMVHKRILDRAETDPDATIEEIAREVSGGTVPLVEQVLEEYGDPGRESPTIQREGGDPEEPRAEDGSQEPLTGEGPPGSTTGGGTRGSADDDPGEAEDEPDRGEDPRERLGSDARNDSQHVADDDESRGAVNESAQRDPGTDEGSEPADESTQRESGDDESRQSATDPAPSDDGDEELREIVTGIEDDLTDEQSKTLRLIYEHPTASQRQIASMLDVTHTTVYHRLQPIDGFEWDDRWEFVSALFDRPDNGDLTAIDRIAGRVPEDGSAGDPPQSAGTVFEHTGLTRKIIHACIDDESITDDELRLIVTDFLRRTADSDGGARSPGTS